MKYMEGLYKDLAEKGYQPVNLYTTIKADSSNARNEFPMNWAISNYYINKMDRQLKNDDMEDLFTWLHKKLNGSNW